MKTIQLELSPKGCDKVVKELAKNDFKRNHKMDEVIARLAEIGLAEAQARFQNGEHSGNDNVSVTLVPIENGYKIVASGQDVFFIEFGTGDAAGKHPMEDRVSIGTYPGSWSETHMQQYSKHGFWVHDHVTYHEIPAEMPMYWAVQAMRDNIKRVMEEVLGK